MTPSDLSFPPHSEPHTPIVDTINGVAYPRTEHVMCPFCSGGHQPRKIPVSFGMSVYIAECASCHLAYQTPRPSLEAALAYMDMRWGSSDPYVFDRRSQLRRALLQFGFVSKLFGAPGRLLDFGAGVGTFMGVARDNGWEVCGVETSKIARARAERENVVVLGDAVASGSRYDLVTLWDVVEHLRDPIATVKMLVGHLAEKGMLVVETGNFETWSRLALGDTWGLYLFDHQYYFSPPSLQRLFNVCGLGSFRVLNTTPHVPSWRLGRHPSRVYGALCAYRQAKARWPQHGRLSLIVAAGSMV